MGENFAFFLPIMMLSFSIAFFIVWRWGARQALFWGIGFLSVAGGFSVPIFAAFLPTHLWGIVADTLFATGFLFFSQALLERWRPGWLMGARLTIWGGSILLCAYAAGIARHVPMELVASDFGCFLLIGVPIAAGVRHLRASTDRALFAAIILVALDNLVRGSTVPLTWSSDRPFGSTEYAFLMQALACLFGLFMALAALAATVVDVIARYRDAAHVDPLSRLLNRRGFDAATARFADADGRWGAVVTCDIDLFKGINDRHGHAMGDRVIAALAALITATIPSDAIAARFGGEEFVVFLPGADLSAAAGCAETIRGRFADQPLDAGGIAVTATASFGLAMVQPADFSLHDAIARADLALYQAKAEGRDRVSIWRPATPPALRVVPDLPATARHG
ncbi:MAG: GGDEF domain-containing protein [Sphingobium sp.]|nr:GGDEF domain-containing protein [Sphingobium sp.]